MTRLASILLPAILGAFLLGVAVGGRSPGRPVTGDDLRVVQRTIEAPGGARYVCEIAVIRGQSYTVLACYE